MARDTRVEVRCTQGDLANWKAAAAIASLPLASWMRSRLVAEAERVAGLWPVKSGCPVPSFETEDDVCSSCERAPCVCDVPEIPDFDLADLLPSPASQPDDAPITVPGPDVVSVGHAGSNWAALSKPAVREAPEWLSSKCSNVRCRKLRTPLCPECKKRKERM